MPRPNKGAHLWLRPPRRDSAGCVVKNAVWIIKDSGRQVSTGCGAGEREAAERKLAEYIASKYAPERRERALSEIRVADVIKIYLDDVAPGHARPEKTAERAERLLEFFGDKRRAMKVTPHVAQNTSGRTSAIDGRTTRHAGYAISQRIRKRIEEGFGWIKTIAGQEKTRFRGRDRVGWAFTFAAAAYNLARLPKLMAAPR